MIHKGKEQEELGECEVTMTDTKTGKVIMTGICYVTDNIELFGTNKNTD